MFEKSSNYIVIGKPATGKTRNYFIPQIKNFKNRVIAIGSIYELAEELSLSGFQVIKNPPENEDVDLSISEKILVLNGHDENPFFKNKRLLKLIEQILTMEDEILLAIDDFSEYKLGNKILEIIEDKKNIKVLLIMGDLDTLRRDYKEMAIRIINNCEIISTKQAIEFSGELKLRLPKSLHQKLSIAADIEGTSLNQYILYLLSGKGEFLTPIHKPNLRHVASEIVHERNNINEIAKQLDLTETAFIDILHGIGPFTDEKALKLCKLLDIDPDTVFFRY